MAKLCSSISQVSKAIATFVTNTSNTIFTTIWIHGITFSWITKIISINRRNCSHKDGWKRKLAAHPFADHFSITINTFLSYNSYSTKLISRRQVINPPSLIS
ncbi:hypothetical protein PUN28_016397 [Cardiocondyla obscurior]|uniref:Uncharacterized protein n=1 Tax=Cardiocondyla obscurior TaxID=286306 RepID=A0AAW2EP84_9HYME